MYIAVTMTWIVTKENVTNFATYFGFSNNIRFQRLKKRDKQTVTHI